MSFLLRHNSLKLGMVFVVVTSNRAGLGPLGVSSCSLRTWSTSSKTGEGAVVCTKCHCSHLHALLRALGVNRPCPHQGLLLELGGEPLPCSTGPPSGAPPLAIAAHVCSSTGLGGQTLKDGETCFLLLFCFLNTFACCQGLWAYL